jgi:hypothetical protein
MILTGEYGTRVIVPSPPGRKCEWVAAKSRLPRATKRLGTPITAGCGSRVETSVQ